MKTLLALLIGIALTAAAGLAAAAGPTIYTWTDASGTTHFSDKPPRSGTAKTLVLPTLPPPDRTAQAANAAWLVQLNKDTQKMLDREAAARLAAERLAAEQAPAAEPYPAYYPVFYGYNRNRFHRRRGFKVRDRDDRGFQTRPLPPIASFPHYQLPSSFPETQTWPPSPNGH